MLTSVPSNLTFVSSFHHYLSTKCSLSMVQRTSDSLNQYSPWIPAYFRPFAKSTHANLKGLVRETPLNLFLDAELWWIFNYSLESRHLYDSLILWFICRMFCLSFHHYNFNRNGFSEVLRKIWNVKVSVNTLLIYFSCVSKTFSISGLIPKKNFTFLFRTTASCHVTVISYLI